MQLMRATPLFQEAEVREGGLFKNNGDGWM